MDLRSALIDTILTEYKKIFNLTEEQENDILASMPSLSHTELIREIGCIEEYYQESKHIHERHLRTLINAYEGVEKPGAPLFSFTL